MWLEAAPRTGVKLARQVVVMVGYGIVPENALAGVAGPLDRGELPGGVVDDPEELAGGDKLLDADFEIGPLLLDKPVKNLVAFAVRKPIEKFGDLARDLGIVGLPVSPEISGYPAHGLVSIHVLPPLPELGRLLLGVALPRSRSVRPRASCIASRVLPHR
ncbi:hypothetical protein CCP3SC15_2750009 [Gammaproteobacteria bacterium]